jgi:hypothetical protein
MKRFSNQISIPDLPRQGFFGFQWHCKGVARQCPLYALIVNT